MSCKRTCEPLSDDFERWLERRSHVKVRRARPLSATTSAAKARSRKVDHPLPRESVCIVVVMTGWSAQTRNAVLRACKTAEALAAPTHLVCVSNHPESSRHLPGAVKDYPVKVVCTENDGFAAACNAGWKASRKSVDWVLFTQIDTYWGPDEVRQALLRSWQLSGESRYLPAIGPSGGYLAFAEDKNGRKYAVVKECGRNNGMPHCPREAAWTDFLTGFWLLVPRKALKEVGGWDESYFLYWEDPDLGLRLARVGCPSLVDPKLKVDHDRGVTILKLWGKDRREEIRRHSMERFLEKWRA